VSDVGAHWTLDEPDTGYCIDCTLVAWLADGSRCLDCLHQEQELDERDRKGAHGRAAHGRAPTSPLPSDARARVELAITAERCSAEGE